MKLFRRKKEARIHDYDGWQPAMKSSICTGETAAGFLDVGGKFQEVMLIAQESDMELFCRKYGVEKEKIRHIF